MTPQVEETVEAHPDNSPAVLSIKVLNARNIKGSKPTVNSFVRIQFADFDHKDVRYD
jgi:hypothetical protein